MAEDNGDVPEHNMIMLELIGLDDAVTLFKIKKRTPLKKVMLYYYQRANLEYGSLQFRFNGRLIYENDTATSLDMEEGDAIEVNQLRTDDYADFSDDS